MEHNNEFEYSKTSLLPYAPVVLVLDVLRRWLLVVTAVLVICVGAYIVMDASYTPEYQTNATLVITTRDSTATVYTNLKSTTDLATVFTELMNSSVLQKVVLEELGAAARDYTVTATAIENTNLMTLQVTSSDPRTAFLVINALIENHGVVTYEVIGDVVIEVLLLPQVPVAPSNAGSVGRNMRLVILAAVVLVCGGLLAYSYLQDTVRSRKEAEKKLNCWCLGEILHEHKHKNLAGLLKKRKASLVITNPHSSFRFVESIHKLRRRVEQYMEGGKVLMVTSVVENEGKSTIAVNLALSLARKHNRVLLIDMDLRKPACHRILGAKIGRYGTMDVINGVADIPAAVVREPLSGLEMVLERRIFKVSTEQITPSLASGVFEAAIEAARETYDYVVLDLPPMSAAPDTEYILEHADAALLVIRQNQVQAKAINRAIATLKSGNAKLLGCVMNNVYTSGFSLESGSEYGYGYGKYGAYNKYKSSGAYSYGNGKD